MEITTFLTCDKQMSCGGFDGFFVEMTTGMDLEK